MQLCKYKVKQLHVKHVKKRLKRLKAHVKHKKALKHVKQVSKVHLLFYYCTLQSKAHKASKTLKKLLI